MNDLDHMLNGTGSRRHHQNIIRQVRAEKFARDIKDVQHKDKARVSVHTLLITLINLVTS